MWKRVRFDIKLNPTSTSDINVEKRQILEENNEGWRTDFNSWDWKTGASCHNFYSSEYISSQGRFVCCVLLYMLYNKSLYMLPLGNIIRYYYGISFHCYADDTQLYISTKPDETSKLSKLTECVKNIKDWMTNHFLLLNSDKTEILLIGPKNSTQNLLDYNLQLDGCTVTSSTVKNLGVILDSNLSFENHTQNAAARVLTRSRKYDHITPILQSLHWLPVKFRISYKISLLAYKALNDLAFFMYQWTTKKYNGFQNK